MSDPETPRDTASDASGEPRQSIRTAVLTVSDTRTDETDTSGRTAVLRLEGDGHQVIWKRIVPDDLLAVRGAMQDAIADTQIDVLITTGGTGVTARDVTPEALQPLITKPIPGFGELFRMISFEEIGTSTIQSRAEGALCGTTFVFVLPGSTGAVRCAMDRILLQQFDSRHKPCNFVQLFGRLGDPPV